MAVDLSLNGQFNMQQEHLACKVCEYWFSIGTGGINREMDLRYNICLHVCANFVFANNGLLISDWQHTQIRKS